MTNKQTMALLYAIDAYLTDKDNETLNAQGNGEYFRGFRDGAAEVIGDVTKLMSEYSFDARRFGKEQAGVQDRRH